MLYNKTGNYRMGADLGGCIKKKFPMEHFEHFNNTIVSFTRTLQQMERLGINLPTGGIVAVVSISANQKLSTSFMFLLRET